MIRGYRLFYDEYNRLTQANYGEGPTISNNSNRYNEYIRYDDNSNVVCITRYGKMQNGNYGIVDNLLYDFKGNQLNSVRDKASSVLYEGALDYKSKGEYAYDANGNMICDTSKGITKISYDDNGKSLRIQFSNGNVTEYIYSATVIQTKGNKKFYPICHQNFNTVYENAILWNPNQGIETNNGTRLSPATGFAHECAHEVNSLEDPNYIDSSKDDSSNPYDSIDEQNVIQGDEQTQAEANGETPIGIPTRSNHDGSPFEVNDPTKTK